MVLAVGFLLLVSLVVSAVAGAAGGVLGRYLPDAGPVLQTVNTFASLVVITALFALMFKFLPDTRIAWKDVWVGAALTSVLFTAGKHLLGLYLGRSSVGSVYGAAGSVVVLIVWVYYAAQIFLFGAELSQAYSRRHGTRASLAGEAGKASHSRSIEPSLDVGRATPSVKRTRRVNHWAPDREGTDAGERALTLLTPLDLAMRMPSGEPRWPALWRDGVSLDSRWQ